MQAYKIPSSKVVYEVLNTEVIAIDFNTGSYFALLHVAKQIWLLIAEGLPVNQIVQLIASHYRRNPGEIQLDVELFIEDLLKNGLIEADEPKLVKNIEVSPGDWAYQPPKVMTYLDVQELLLIDPIHEVAEVGWPNKL